ncbi:helix-turn-helix domain-containing protein [Sulfitobacter sabulilitoris]|uniref:Helix-turn-helix domain-containing protein n=1 Tax=Sulfitobacter sabulilitoris TaxID=2562655 RepID=A0A5S3PH04_9RHOB|nr:helix-turn-helix domain-containing protein [Sulfitobacter sabulilitoris]TMM50932.1 helix-turn-helix domain-containing protein [Sulfitobacter sabulilitoris]
MDESDNWYGPETATFGDRVAAAREAAGMSQAQLAKRLGVRLATLRGWEDDLSEPRANRLSMMAGLLNVSMTWLMNGQGQGLSAPEDTAALPETAKELLVELRDMRADMVARAEQMARFEKKLRAAIKEDAQ